MNKRVLVAALGAAMAGMGGLAGNAVEIVRRPGEPDIGWINRRGYSGRLRSRTTRMRRVDAYKAQRRANRLRRKALNK